MNGPQCYQRALAIINSIDGTEVTPSTTAALAAAQVFATLAQAAATVDAQRGGTAVWGSWPAVGEPS